MNRHRTGLLLAILLAPLCATAAPNMNEGEWQFEMQMQMKGMPMNMPPMRFTNCLKPGDVVPTPERQMTECRKSNERISGNTVSWTMLCNHQNTEMEMRGTATFNGDTMNGSMDQTMRSGGRAQMTSSGTISGKRVGPCKAK